MPIQKYFNNLTLGLPRGHFDPSEKTFHWFSSRKPVFQEFKKTSRKLTVFYENILINFYLYL